MVIHPQKMYRMYHFRQQAGSYTPKFLYPLLVNPSGGFAASLHCHLSVIQDR